MSTVTLGLQGVPMVRSSGGAVPAPRLSVEPRGRRQAALVVLCAAALIVNVDNTILNVALPTLVRKLAATSSELQWIVDSYAMVFAGLLLVGGSLADRFGRKRFFLIGLGVFRSESWPPPRVSCSGSSTPTRWSSRVCYSSAVAWPTGSGASGFSSSAWAFSPRD